MKVGELCEKYIWIDTGCPKKTGICVKGSKTEHKSRFFGTPCIFLLLESLDQVDLSIIPFTTNLMLFSQYSIRPLQDSTQATDGYLDSPVRRSQSQADLRPRPGGAGGGAGGGDEQRRHQGEHRGQGRQGGGLICFDSDIENYCYAECVVNIMIKIWTIFL